MSDKYHIGLDIGANTIKAVSLSPTKTGFVKVLLQKMV